MKRTVAVAATAVIFVGSAAGAHARAISPSTKRLGAGTTAVTAASLHVTLTNSGSSQGGGGPVIISSGLATVPVSPAVPNAAFNDLRLVISGP